MDFTTAVVISGDQDAGDNAMVLRTVEMHLLKLERLFQQDKGILFLTVLQQIQNCLTAVFMTLITYKMPILAARVGRFRFAANAAFQEPLF